MRFAVSISLCFLAVFCTDYNEAQEITVQPVNTTACVGSDGSFTCVVDRRDVPITSVGWEVFDVRFISADGRDRHMINFTVNEDEDILTSILTVSNVMLSDDGDQYRCRPVVEEIGDVVFLNVISDPPNAAPTISTVQVMSSSSFTVNWTLLNPSYSYQICWTNLKNNEMLAATVPLGQNSYTIGNLTGVDNYNVSVATVNECGMMTSDPVTVYDPPGIPMNIMFPEEDITGASFIVQWEMVDSFFTLTYIVTWTDGNDTNATNTTSTSYTVSGLTMNTMYSVTVTAINSCCGAGRVSDVFNVTTNSREPTSPPSAVGPSPTSGGGGGSDRSSTGAIVGGVVGGIVAVIVIIVIIVVVYIFVIHPKDDSNGDKKALRMTSPSGTGTGTGGRATVTPSSNVQSGPTEVYADIHKPVPHQTAATGEEYAVSNKKPKPQGPTEEYAQIDKSKKSGQQGIQYADLADLPQSTNDPSGKGPTSMYAQVA